MDIQMVVCHLDIMALEAIADLFLEVAHDGPVVSVLYPNADDIADCAVAVIAYEDDGVGIVEDQIGAGDGILQSLADIGCGSIVGCRNCDVDAACGFAGVVDDPARADRAVGNMDELVVGGAELGVDDADVSDGALGAAGLYIVTQLEGVAGEDHNSACQVGEGILNSQREGEADYAEEGDEGGDVDAHHAADGDDDDGPHEDIDHLEEDGLEVVVDLHAAESLCEEAHKCLLDDEADDEGSEGIESAAEGDGAENAGDGCCVHFHCLLYIILFRLSYYNPIGGPIQ